MVQGNNKILDACKTDAGLILRFFKGWEFDPDSRNYLRFHARRYAFLLKLLRECVGGMYGGKCERLLDIGPNFLTEFLRGGGEIAEIIDGLGFWDGRFSLRDCDTHHEFDLRNVVDRSMWPDTQPYDLVVMAEVIEHLPVSTASVFAFLASLVRPGGHLILQTPNACSLSKRLKMLIGRNPFELIREDHHNPGHFREYTTRELRGFAQAAGFRVHRVYAANYFSGDRWFSKVAAAISFALPASLRNGITMWLVREQPGSGLSL